MEPSQAPWSLWQKLMVGVAAATVLVFVGWLEDYTSRGKKKKTTKSPEDELREQLARMSQGQGRGQGRAHAHDHDHEDEGNSKDLNTQIQMLLKEAKEASSSGNYDKAQECYEEGLEIVEKEVGEEHPVTWLFQSMLANTFKEKGQLSQAEELMLRCIASMEAATESERVAPELVFDQFVEGYSSMTEIYFQMKDYDKAEKYMTLSVNVLQKKEALIKTIPVFSRDRKEAVEEEMKKIQQTFVVLLDTQSKIKWKQNDWELAESLTKQLIGKLFSMMEDLGTFLLETSFRRLGQIYLDQGKTIAEANDAINQGIEDLKSSLTSSSGIGVLSLFLANFNFDNNNFEEAQKIWRQAIEQLEADENPKFKNLVPLALNNLSSALRELGRVEEANQFLNEMKNKVKETKKRAPLTLSKYLTTQAASVVFSSELKPQFSLTLEHKAPEGSFLVASFQNPEEGAEPFVVEQATEKDKKTVKLESPLLDKIGVGYYDAVVKVLNESKTEVLSEHHVMISSLVDTSDFSSREELMMKLYEAHLKELSP